MPIYALDDLVPQTPGEGRVWVAPDAHVMGNVSWPKMWGFGSAPFCVAIMNRSASAHAAISRKVRCCTPIRVFL